MRRIPLELIINELYSNNQMYVVDRELFAVISRVLNEHGYVANVIASLPDDLLRFIIKKDQTNG
jgi:hypothetical protein